MEYVIFSTITVTWFVLLSLMLVKKLTFVQQGTMEKMVASMIISMPSTFLFGLLCTVLYKGNLIVATFLSICVSIVIAGMIGVFIGFLPFIEALFTGFMSGLMGAMLGEMVSIETTIAALPYLLLWIIVAITFLLILTKTWIRRPIARYILPLLLLVYFAAGHEFFYPDEANLKEEPTKNEQKHIH